MPERIHGAPLSYRAVKSIDPLFIQHIYLCYQNVIYFKLDLLANCIIGLIVET